MLKLLFFVCVSIFVCLCASNSYADRGQAKGFATIVDPYTMPEHEAVLWCFENPESVKCQRLEEQWAQEKECTPSVDAGHAVLECF